jgi:alkanesulfonate monooxygenase SsuD/methylene tetrahydromethanopterin reductase-like flavin-dependent oxidoreductase (luciferase family)
MRYGFIIPDLQDASIAAIAELAHEAEQSGWDGVFFWDADWHISPWVAIAAMALATRQARLGAILHPLAWRQPWLFARDSASLDQLSQGRLTISIGMGAVETQDFARGRTRFGSPVDRAVRAQLIDEGLDIVNGLWSGKPFSYHSQHYDFDAFQLQVTPVQQPRIPIWAVGMWGKPKSMARVARCDGMLVSAASPIAEIQAIQAFIAEQRSLSTPFELVMEADTRNDTPDVARSKANNWAEQGIAWWVESMWSPGITIAMARERISMGPPR